jgi:hypothetical protein
MPDSSVLEDSFSITRLKREGTILALTSPLDDPSRVDSSDYSNNRLNATFIVFLLMVASNPAIAEWMLASVIGRHGGIGVRYL